MINHVAIYHLIDIKTKTKGLMGPKTGRLFCIRLHPAQRA
jgi:hypothetical protein